MARRRGYRKTLFASEEQRVEAAQALEAQVSELWQQLDSGRISPQRFCSAQIYQAIRHCQSGRPLGGGLPHRENHSEDMAKGDRSLQDSICFSWPRTHTLKAVPWAVNRSLLRWESFPQQLILFDRILNLEEILDLQCEGKRCVSFFRGIQNLEAVIADGRDAWSFMIHDLIHADHFFSDETLALGQIEFYRWLRDLISQGQICQLIAEPEFFRALAYIVSDMNAHPQHLLQTLVAETLNYLKRQSLVVGAPQRIPLSQVWEIFPQLRTSQFANG
jgi:hypothetical protein